jgi:two-component system, response regulator / RNA-binding antiterminator
MQGPTQNFRGRTALLLMQEDLDAKTLCNTLNKLGVKVTLCDHRAGGDKLRELTALADIAIVDTDVIEPADVALFTNSHLPIIALIGLESPTRLQRAHDIEPTAVIMKPVRANGIFTAFYFAFNEKRRRQQLRDALASSTERLAARRIIVKAIVHLMQCLGFDDEEAYKYLRKKSMSRRVSVEELSAQILADRQTSQNDKKTRA